MKTIAEYMLYMIQNSINAEATSIEIMIDENEENDVYTMTVLDNGHGIAQNENVLSQSSNPDNAGEWMLMLKQDIEQCRGKLEIKTKENRGTAIKASFQQSKLERLPLGDIWNAYYIVLLENQRIRLNYRHRTDDGIFNILSQEIRAILEWVPMEDPEIKNGITKMIKNQLTDIKATF